TITSSPDGGFPQSDWSLAPHVARRAPSYSGVRRLAAALGWEVGVGEIFFTADPRPPGAAASRRTPDPVATRGPSCPVTFSVESPGRESCVLDGGGDDEFRRWQPGWLGAHPRLHESPRLVMG